VHYRSSLNRTFFALSDQKRREILDRLSRGPVTLGQLAEPYGLTLNGVKKHVSILEEVGLVETEKVGRTRQCRLGPERLDDAAHWIDEHQRTWRARLDRFGDYVDEGGR
jgi:DNA-binding transcriptional ArsR family regulator